MRAWRLRHVSSWRTVHGVNATNDDTDGDDAMDLGRLAYKLKDVARLLSLSPSKVRDMAAKGEIEVFKIGRVRRVHGTDLAAYIERQKKAEQRDRAS